MSGVSIEETLELWAASPREVKARMRPLFPQDRVAASVGLFLDGPLEEERRKTGWMRAEAAGDPGPWRQQAILRGNFNFSVVLLTGSVLVAFAAFFIAAVCASCLRGHRRLGPTCAVCRECCCSR
jgi:hypothetical protein